MPLASLHRNNPSQDITGMGQRKPAGFLRVSTRMQVSGVEATVRSPARISAKEVGMHKEVTDDTCHRREVKDRLVVDAQPSCHVGVRQPRLSPLRTLPSAPFWLTGKDSTLCRLSDLLVRHSCWLAPCAPAAHCPPCCAYTNQAYCCRGALALTAPEA